MSDYEPSVKLRHVWARVGYQPLARLLHHFHLHHTRRIGPMEDGTTIHRCEWCGLSRRDVPMHVTVERMKAREARAPRCHAPQECPTPDMCSDFEECSWPCG